MLSVAHRFKGDRTYADIRGVMALPKGVPAPTLEGAILMHPNANDPTTLDRVPEFLRKKIDEQIRSTPAAAPPAPARQAAAPPAPARQTAAPQPVEEFADDIPF